MKVLGLCFRKITGSIEKKWERISKSEFILKKQGKKKRNKEIQMLKLPPRHWKGVSQHMWRKRIGLLSESESKVKPFFSSSKIRARQAASCVWRGINIEPDHLISKSILLYKLIYNFIICTCYTQTCTYTCCIYKCCIYAFISYVHRIWMNINLCFKWI